MAKNLVNAPSEKCFWVHNGPIVKNLKELLGAIQKMKNETFMHHVNKNKNDFGKWISEVLKEEKLAKALEKVQTKQGFIKLIKKEIS